MWQLQSVRGSYTAFLALSFALPFYDNPCFFIYLHVFFLILLPLLSFQFTFSLSLCLPFSENKVKDNIYRKPPIYKQHGTVQSSYNSVSLHALMHVTMVLVTMKPVTFDLSSVCWFPFQLLIDITNHPKRFGFDNYWLYIYTWFDLIVFKRSYLALLSWSWPQKHLALNHMPQ